MTPEEFVEALHHSIRRGAVEGSIMAARDPPGRRVAEFERARSAWISSLSESEFTFFESTIRNAVDLVIFGFLGTLDGVNVIDASGTQGEFELIYRHGENIDIIAPTEDNCLHDMYRDKIGNV